MDYFYNESSRFTPHARQHYCDVNPKSDSLSRFGGTPLGHLRNSHVYRANFNWPRCPHLKEKVHSRKVTIVSRFWSIWELDGQNAQYIQLNLKDHYRAFPGPFESHSLSDMPIIDLSDSCTLFNIYWSPPLTKVNSIKVGKQSTTTR